MSKLIIQPPRSHAERGNEGNRKFLLLGGDHSSRQEPPDCGPAGAIKFLFLTTGQAVNN